MTWILGKDSDNVDVWVNLDQISHIEFLGSRNFKYGPKKHYLFHYGGDRPVSVFLRHFETLPQIIPALPGFVKLTVVPPQSGPIEDHHIERSSVVAWRYFGDGEPLDPIGADDWGNSNATAFIDPLTDKVFTGDGGYDSVQAWIDDLNSTSTKEVAA